MITKDNVILKHDDNMWYCEILISNGFRYVNGWAWSSSANTALNLAVKNALHDS